MCLAFTLTTYWLLDLYSMQFVGSGLYEYRAIVTYTTFAFAAIVIFGYIDDGLAISRAFLLIYWLSAIVLVGIGRFTARRLVRWWSRTRGGLRRVIIVGANEQGVQIARELASNPAACSTVLGFLSEYRPVGQHSGSKLPVLGEPMQLYEVSNRLGATHAVVVESALSWESLRFIVRSMHSSRAPEVLLAPGLLDVAATPLQSTQLGQVMLLVPRATRIVGFEAFFKRSLDLLIALPALVISLPIQLWIWIYLRTKGVGQPIKTFRALGFGGRTITVRQFEGGPLLRASHLSRLPSLWLVVRGAMSIVGPRPMVVGDHGLYERWSDVLTALKPGFIGPWWLSYSHRPTMIQLEIRADLEYARSYTIWADLRILQSVAFTLIANWLRLLRGARRDQRQITGAAAVGTDED
jgi:lipopolysaccharide/colanic/teichoic acid biosynthesis glycosyltransferase